MLALVLGDEKAGNLPLHRSGDQHRPRVGRRLHARRDIGRLAEHLARSVDDDGSGFKTDPSGKVWRAGARVARVEIGERAVDRECGAHRTLGVVLLRLRIAEERHQAVAKLLQDTAAERCHRR